MRIAEEASANRALKEGVKLLLFDLVNQWFWLGLRLFLWIFFNRRHRFAILARSILARTDILAPTLRLRR